MKTVCTYQLLIILLLLPVLSKAQLVVITGKVIHGKNGEVLKNVSVFEPGLNIGTITDENGFFKLILTKGDRIIKISDNGFNGIEKSLEVSSDTSLFVQLYPKLKSKSKRKKQDTINAMHQQLSPSEQSGDILLEVK